MRRTALLLIFAVAGVAAAQDSPYVALAKRTNRKAKSPVITNETVANSKGRLSTPAGETTPAENAMRFSAPTSAKTAKPAVKAQESTQPALPQTTAKNLAPQSTAPVVKPQSTAPVVAPQSTAPVVKPQSTNRAAEPGSTAKNVNPY